MNIDPFLPLVPAKRLNENFRALMEGQAWSPAREIIRELFKSFYDPDGNFLEQFQTTGFDARVWELYLWAYFLETDFVIDRLHAIPDFHLGKSGVRVYVEAVTANPTQGLANSPKVTSSSHLEGELDRLLEPDDHVAIKLGSPLFSKLQKRYWELEHVKGRPLIFAIEDFHSDNSLFRSSATLGNYLYAFRHHWDFDAKGRLRLIIPESIQSHQREKKVIPSGFFELPGAENVSAVLFSNSGTVTKFNRMGYLAGYRPPNVKMVRSGTCYNHGEEYDTVLPIKFAYEVGDPEFTESWGQGLEMYHNPWALHPVEESMFPEIAHLRLDNGLIRCVVPKFHPLGSVTHIIEINDSEEGTNSINQQPDKLLPHVFQPVTPQEVSALLASKRI